MVSLEFSSKGGALISDICTVGVILKNLISIVNITQFHELFKHGIKIIMAHINLDNRES